MDSIPVRKLRDARIEPSFSGNFSIRDLSQLMAGHEMIQELHRHDYYFLLALMDARGEHSIDFISYQVNKYTIFLMRPGQVHKLLLKTGASGYLLQFSPEIYPLDLRAKRQLRSVSQQNYFRLNKQTFEELNIHFQRLAEENKNKAASHDDAIRACLDLLFIDLFRIGNQQEYIDPSKGMPAKRERLEEFLELMEMNRFGNKKVSDYAEMLHLSQYQLNAMTKQLLDKTCSELLNEQMILEAKRQLLATNNQIKEISYLLGYEDVSYFIRFFRKHTGLTPAHFRQSFK